MPKYSLFSGLALGAFLLSAQAQSTNTGALAVWDSTTSLYGSFGYRENVLRSSMVNENSAFFMTSADASLMRLSETDAYFMFYFFGEDIRYFNAPTVNYEQFFSISAQGAMPVGDKSETGLAVDYLYQHQIYDASETQDIQRRLLILGHSLSARPYWTWFLSPKWEATLDAATLRQIYEQDLDDYTEGDVSIFLDRIYGNRSTVGIGYQYLKRFYDTRLQTDESGLNIPDTDLVYTQHEFSGDWKHYWDENRNWRSMTRLSGMLNRDNGSGYFDYDRVLFREQLRWDDRTWAVLTNIRLGWYSYLTQQIGDENRERTYAMVDVRVERRFWQHGVLFAAGEYEWDWSNDPLDEYRTWMAHAGIGLEF
ncbi:hypothetical protein P4C99_05060 [Pontiellaceae bacterium B1224]|nr:hypothetical protein [Pontiellaceae bacterium B1224]